jgi:hypothetical protein
MLRKLYIYFQYAIGIAIGILGFGYLIFRFDVKMIIAWIASCCFIGIIIFLTKYIEGKW